MCCVPSFVLSTVCYKLGNLKNCSELNLTRVWYTIRSKLNEFMKVHSKYICNVYSVFCIDLKATAMGIQDLEKAENLLSFRNNSV